MIVTATSVDADPMGVRFPPRFAPKMTDHHRFESSGMFCAERIFASIAASGMLSVTDEATAAEVRRSASEACVFAMLMIGFSPSPMSCSTSACSMT